MTETLREKQKRVAREAILQATADEIVERGLGEFSLQEVAARAGVSIRTLYNYFESRDQLFLALATWSDELTLRLGGTVRIPALDELPTAAVDVWKAWEQQGTVYLALLRIDAAEAGPVPDQLRADRRQRTRQIQAAVAERRPDLSAVEVEDIAVLLHAMLGPALWDRMAQLAGFGSERSGPVTAWAMGLIVDALDRGDSPRSGEVEPAGDGGAATARAPR